MARSPNRFGSSKRQQVTQTFRKLPAGLKNAKYAKAEALRNGSFMTSMMIARSLGTSPKQEISASKQWPLPGMHGR
ncbi:MAG: hypothetical protein MK240_01105 [Opitutales bacterium]|nr:hypothetical protein [Opitutales bacterium]